MERWLSLTTYLGSNDVLERGMVSLKGSRKPGVRPGIASGQKVISDTASHAHSGIADLLFCLVAEQWRHGGGIVHAPHPAGVLRAAFTR